MGETIAEAVSCACGKTWRKLRTNCLHVVSAMVVLLQVFTSTWKTTRLTSLFRGICLSQWRRSSIVMPETLMFWLLPPENIRFGLTLETTESPIRTLEMPGPTLHSANCWRGVYKLFPLSCSRQGESARSFPDGILVLFGKCMDSSAATWISVQTTMSLSSDSSLSSSCPWSTANLLDVGTAMKSVVLVGSLGASPGFDELSNEMAGGVGVLVWRLCTVFTFCSSVFSKLLSFFKRSRSSKKGISCWDAHLRKS